MEHTFSASREGYNNNMVSLTTQDCDNEASRLEIPMSISKAAKKDELANNQKGDSQNPPNYQESESGFKNNTTCVIRGRVLQQNTDKTIEGVLVTLRNECDGTIQTVYTDASGFYEFTVAEGCEYTIEGTKTNLASQGKTITNLSCINDGLTVDISMFGTGDIVQIENIYFDYGKYNIRSDAREGIDKLVKLMRQYPAMTIKLGSHTDSRSPSDFNQTLSDGRARESAEYLFKRGISRSRVTFQGYGETKILNGCVDGVKCSEAQHQLNRRTEFEIIKMD
jgi:outer membrane protein OmpA-like peptidoglycan-associated protein